jgi:hypothetical protein
MVITPHFQCGDLGSIPGTCSNETDRRRFSFVERNLGSVWVATILKKWQKITSNYKVTTYFRGRMAQGTLFRTLLCVATQQVMGNKPSVKSGDNGFITGSLVKLAITPDLQSGVTGSKPVCIHKDRSN